MKSNIGIVSNYQQINRSCLNQSITKALYSFPKAERFRKPRQSYCQRLCYDLPSTRSQRTCSLGYGKKIKLDRTSDAPSPQKYDVSSSYRNRRGHSFGIGREMLYVSNKDNSQFPGPGQQVNIYNQFRYPQQTTMAKVAYSIRGKLSQNIKNDVPGPGAYDPLSTLDCRFPLSTYRRPGAVLMRKSIQTSREKNTGPGPGQYEEINKKQVTGTKFFPTYKRDILMKNDSPGVGKYDLPSEFGFYGRAQRLHTIQ
ncbi:hypothetical protein pb186bvf_012137 [Paramecium bursaria]